MMRRALEQERARHWVARHRPGRRVRWGDLRRTRPFSEAFGYDRGTAPLRVNDPRFAVVAAARVQRTRGGPQ